MNEQELGMVLKYRQANWPSALVTDDVIEVFRLEVGSLDFEDTIETLREDFADSDFPPSPMKLRKVVMNRGVEPVTAELLVNEVLAEIKRVGHTSTPHWSHPAIEEWIRRSGGWKDVCGSARAPDAPGYGTWYAQARDLMRPLLAWEEQQRQSRDLKALGNDRRELEEGGE